MRGGKETRLCPALSARLAISWTPAFQDSHKLTAGHDISTGAYLEPKEGGQPQVAGA